MSVFLTDIFGGDSFSQKKPSGVPVQKTLDKFDKPPSRAVIVGDGDTDINSGKTAGILTVGVTYGFRGIEPVREADIIIDDIVELKRHLK